MTDKQDNAEGVVERAAYLRECARHAWDRCDSVAAEAFEGAADLIEALVTPSLPKQLCR